MAPIFRPIKKAVKKAVKWVGDTVSDVGDWVVDEIVEPVVDAVDDVIAAVKDDPLKAIVTVAAVATGNAWAIPLIEGADVAQNGGDIGDILEASAKAYVAGQVGVMRVLKLVLLQFLPVLMPLPQLLLVQLQDKPQAPQLLGKTLYKRLLLVEYKRASTLDLDI